jgi:hypothetical protein
MTLRVYLPCTVIRVGWPWLPVIPIRKLQDRGQHNDTVRLIEHTLRDAMGNIESFLIAAVRAARRVQRSQPRALHPTRHPIAEGLPRHKGYSLPSVLELGIPLGVWKGPRLRIKHT